MSLFPLRLPVLVLLLAALPAAEACAQPDLPPDAPRALQQFDADWSNRTIDLTELRSGGPPKDGIPALDDPAFVSPDAAARWVAPQEPVIAFLHNGDARAYPLQILTYHEIVNDRVGGVPVAVTFCPLCYSAVVFKRTVSGTPVSFGVSGLLRKSDMIMYDRRTETLWQQLTGKALVGDLAGTTLPMLPAQIISFAQFRQNHPSGHVLSRNTGHDRPYGTNPYAGYDDVDARPFLYDGPSDGRLPPMEKVVALSLDGTHVAYPHRTTRKKRVWNDTVAGRPIVVLHTNGAVSALDNRQIADSKAIGSTGVFDRRVDGRALTFEPAGEDQFTDIETGSLWTVTGRAVKGPLAGTRLCRLPHKDPFAFAWFAFRPETEVRHED